MKKILCGLLAAVMTLSLCACGEDKDDDRDERKSDKDKNHSWNEEQNEELPVIQPAEPSEENEEPSVEDVQALTEYYYLVVDLNRNSVDLNYNTSRQQIYDRLLELSAVDKWCGTEFASASYLNINETPDFDNSTDWNRQAILQKFYVIPDVRISYTITETDHLGNAFQTDSQENIYNAEGQLICQYIADVEMESLDSPIMDTHNTDCTRIYDETGRPTKIEYRAYNSDTILVVQDFIYNEQGQIIEQVFKSNTEERSKVYNYNEKGLCTSVAWDGEYEDSTEILYTYDENGRVLTAERIEYYSGKEISEKKIFTFVYDAAGTLTSGTFEQQYWGGIPAELYQRQIDQYTYKLDEQGRIVQISIVPGANEKKTLDGIWTSDSPAQYASVVYDIHYGNYCGFQNETDA